MKRIESLAKMPRLGRVDEYLSGEFEYRYLIEGNYRIYYEIISEDNVILVRYLFDTRQDLVKISDEFPK